MAGRDLVARHEWSFDSARARIGGFIEGCIVGTILSSGRYPGRGHSDLKSRQHFEGENMACKKDQTHYNACDCREEFLAKRIHGLEKSLAEAKEEINEQCRINGMGAQRELKLMTEMAVLRSAFSKYGRHAIGCEKVNPCPPDFRELCTCGFEAETRKALAGQGGMG